MSYIPAFELGLWNAWMFILPFFLLPFIGDKLTRRRDMASLSEYIAEFSKKRKILLVLLVTPIWGSYVYSVFLPFKLGTIWFYIGAVIFILGIIIQIITWYELASAPIDKPVTKGLYRVSRNPMYIGDFLVHFSIAIACLSWIFLIVVLISIV
ncbi:MAG: methyltransferase, partial [Promethearchaeota archaeon]